MKVGIAVNAKTGVMDWSHIKLFQDEHWESINLRNIRGQATGWVAFPRVNVFISFSECNRKFMEFFQRHFEESLLIKPIIVESYRQGGIALSHLVTTKIDECKYFLPILSEESIATQWVNQEIGYATAKGIRIVPVVETKIMHQLKGFIHSQLQLPYLFDIGEENPGNPDNIPTIQLGYTIREDLENEVARTFNIVEV